MFEGLDMNALMAQAQQMQTQMAQAQEELAATEFTGSAGGDLVSATLKGDGELVELDIKPAACDPEDTQTLSDLIVAAVRDARRQVDEAAHSALPQLPQGFGL